MHHRGGAILRMAAAQIKNPPLQGDCGGGIREQNRLSGTPKDKEFRQSFLQGYGV